MGGASVVRSTSRGVRLARTQAGLLVPVGCYQDITDASRTTFAALGDKVATIERLFQREAVDIRQNSGLGQVLAEARTFPAHAIAATATRDLRTLSMRGCWINRMLDAVLSLEHAPGTERILRELSAGNMDLVDGRRSKAKDTLWEVEMYALLRGAGLRATLEDPPDVVVELEAERVGISCKNLYSNVNIRKTLSRAVSQVEACFDLGVAAFNIANLTVKPDVLHVNTVAVAGEMVRREIEEFLAAHERHFAIYLPRGRIGAAIVANMRIAEVEVGTPRFHCVQEFVVWNVDGLDERKRHLLGLVAKHIGENGP